MINVKELASSVESDVLSYWKHIHQNPELSMKEYKTSEFVEKILKETTNVDVIHHVGETGLLVEIHGTKAGEQKTFAIRADMDALPVQEKTNLPYASQCPNVMHACGHDVHTSTLLGVVRMLDSIKDQFSGKVICIFQPGEEVMEGAKQFIKSEHIDYSKIDGIACLHVSPEINAGTIGVKKGPILASSDSLTITVKGKQGHGAHPHTVVDSILIASHIIVALQSLVSRETAPGDSAVLSFGCIQGGEVFNIVPETVTLKGTLRALNPNTRKQLIESINRVAKGVAQSMRGDAEVDIILGPPPLICEDEWIDRLERVTTNLLGEGSVVHMPVASMGAEDFAFMKELVPGVFFRLGTRTPNGPYGSMHSPFYYSDEKSFITGLTSMVGLTLDYLGAEYN